VTILLDNAIKYTNEGGVTVGLEQDREFAYIKVTDTGQGIPGDMHEKIFERFVRTDKARSRAAGGAGLGLSIAKTIAEEHGGAISVESEVGKGSTFCVKLPLVII
jgi:signal transduction histidine kinase